MPRRKVLYISTLGVSEPLARSQVLEYLFRLEERFEIFLFSFEKNPKEVFEVQHELLNHSSVQFQWAEYFNSNGILSTIRMFFAAAKRLSRLVKSHGIELVHARSLLGALVALYLKWACGTPYLYDIRGFQIDEKAEIGRIKLGGLTYRCLKQIERLCLRQSEQIVTLTEASVELIEEFVDQTPITVIPTCASKSIFYELESADIERFRAELGVAADTKLIIHTGTVKNWYDFKLELNFVKEVMRLVPESKFLILSNSDSGYIRRLAKREGLEDSALIVRKAAFFDVNWYLNVAWFSVFFCKPTYSKIASAPTKLAENLACGLFSVSNAEMGDLSKIFNEYPETGMALSSDFLRAHPKNSAKKVVSFLKCYRPESDQFRQLFNSRFDVDSGSAKYASIYENILKTPLK